MYIWWFCSGVMMEDVEGGIGRVMSVDREIWSIGGRNVPKTEVVFFCQMFMLYIVVITCIINLSLGSGESNLWVVLLSMSLGAVLPNPKMKVQQRNRAGGGSGVSNALVVAE